jgi:hypothetical protein
MQYTRIQKGEDFSLSWVATLVLMPWKMATPFEPQHITLVTKSWLDNPPKPFTEFQIMFVRLSIVQPSVTHSRFIKIGVLLKSSTT